MKGGIGGGIIGGPAVEWKGRFEMMRDLIEINSNHEEEATSLENIFAAIKNDSELTCYRATLTLRVRSRLATQTGRPLTLSLSLPFLSSGLTVSHILKSYF